MSNIFGFTGKYINFWLNFFSNSNDEVLENYCRVEYGKDWSYAYNEFKRTKKFPNSFKEAA